MDTRAPSPLLGGLTPGAFMRRHWQKQPLLVRQAVPGGVAVASRAQAFALAAHDEVESRLIVRRGADWSVRHGPLPRRALPPLSQAGWTLLVQGLDLHLPAARALLERFRFLPDARLDDLMLSYATDGGGVGPHVDSYDVFLLQAQGRRRWRIGRVADPALVADAPLKLLANFSAEAEWLLEPGDMLYLPPGWAHDGVAEGECITCSIGFRAPGADEIGREVLQRLLDAEPPDAPGRLYRDAAQAATDAPGRVPERLGAFAARGIARLAGDADALACALGEVLSEPKRGVWFDTDDADDAADAADADEAAPFASTSGVRLDIRSRMLYDDRRIYLNGESYRAAGRDALLMRRLADLRGLAATEVRMLSAAARSLLGEWRRAGWVRHAGDAAPARKR